MREILFRAKNLYSNEWVDGFLVASKCNTYPDGFEMITYQGINHDELDDYQPDFLSFHVDPETVGQFTGLADKNGKKIFEGDIVKYGKHTMVVVWYDFLASFTLAFSVDGYYHETMSKSDTYLEIIGNIHDNPELLENP